ncbi:hypothetical protein TD95_002206 [Thielaviopsis punctulata]|uniref:Mitochondrial import inner membrane translocase subunit TIM50 n=1 Tax=Thielaviopsis punctulata TaxID=72032 RepID=A0A0F4ZEK6_9PEZI|nr:hypothetical protein TD95_002206 [Thielaviopsis punctulata]
MLAFRLLVASRIPVSFSRSTHPQHCRLSALAPLSCAASYSYSTASSRPKPKSARNPATSESNSPKPTQPSTLSAAVRQSYIDAYIATPQVPELRGAPRKKLNYPSPRTFNTHDRRSAHLRKSRSPHTPYSDDHILMALSTTARVAAASTTARTEDRSYAVPSAASGGVPEASAAYLAQAALAPRTCERPRRILVVLDLNGTLLWRPSRRNPTSFVERPHTRQFLDYLVKNFVVVVWSSAQPDNVNHMVNHLFTKKERQQLAAVWGRDKFGLSNKDYSSRVQVYKRLTKLWADETVQSRNPASHPWDQTNTVLVDDSSEKARSEPFNLIRIPEFAGQKETTHILPQVHDYLNILAGQEDISAYIHKSPFEHNLNFTL